MKKFFVIIIVFLMLFASGCDAVLGALEKYENEQTSSATITTAKPSNADTTYATSTYDGPTLPNLDFENLDLFEDGYEIVEFDYAPDGDTAIFAVGTSSLKTRFFGVDTTEMSTDSGIPEDWAVQAKQYTNDMLYTANEIILELDDNSDAFDDFDRLLAWIWVDGQLLNYMLASRGYADVKYLYDDYKYNNDLLDAEYSAQNKNLGIWSDDVPYYDPNENFATATEESSGEYITIQQARNMNLGSIVVIKGVVTSKIDNNAFIEDETGGIYLYTKNRSYSALSVGNEIIIKGELTDYNGLLELINFDDSDIKIVSLQSNATPETITLSQINESIESRYIRIENVKITFVDYTKSEQGYSIFIEQNGAMSEVRIDKHLLSYPDPESLKAGDIINVVGNISQHHDTYQIMIADKNAITYP